MTNYGFYKRKGKINMYNNIDMRSELCKTCIHTKVCSKDKNIIGDRFMMGHPMLFDNDKLWEKYKEWKAKGFPCGDYIEGRV